MLMIGIYKITNLINGHSYVGQSRQIQKRWENHIIASGNVNDSGYNYPLYRAFRKYGISNFSFEIIEECSVDELNEKEKYWIKFYKCEYNQTVGGDAQVTHSKLTLKQVLEIQQRLVEDKDGILSHKELASEYGVHKDTIRDINVGRTWYNENLEYPLHYSQYDANKPNSSKKSFNFCIECGKQIFKTSIRCTACENQIRKKNSADNSRISREELKQRIRTETFVNIGKDFSVTDNTIKKWCKRFNLPFKKSDIKKYTDDEWKAI